MPAIPSFSGVSRALSLQNCTWSLRQLRNFLAEWDEGEDGHLEMLHAERDSDYGQAACYAESDMEKSDLYSSEDDPDDIHDDGEAAAVVGVGMYVSSERPESKSGHLDELESKRDSDDGDAEQNTHQGIIETDHKASHDQPEYVS